MTISIRAPSLLSALVLALVIAAAPAQGPISGGRFRDLSPEQQAPIRSIVEEYARISGTPQDSERLYDSARLSVRTTYDAISNALLATPLTTADGRSLGNAFSLIEGIEEIAGEVRGASGDRQFRIYAALRPGAVDLLRQSREFRQGPDNTVYHKGFPLNFRQEGMPSIQFSISADERHADIDVDYRSARFPVGLFNGHLTSANSDIRIGGNYPRHLQRWQGLSEWWANVFGITAQIAERLEEIGPDVAGRSRPAARGKVEEAAADFFKAWLLERQVREAASYFSRTSFECLEADARDRGDDVPPGLILAKTSLDMTRYAASGQDISRLDQWMAPLEPWDPRLLPVRHSTSAAFSLFKVPESLAEQDLACAPAGNAAIKSKDKYGKYYATVNRFRTSAGEWSPAILMIWTKEQGRWRIVRTRVAEDASQPFIALTRRPAESEPESVELVEGDGTAIAAVNDWLEAWFVRRDYRRAMTYVSPLAKSCNPGASDKDGEDGYARVAGKTGRVRRLRDAIQPATPWAGGTRVVNQRFSGSFTLIEASEAMLRQLACSPDTPRVVTSPPNHYAVLFSFRAKSMNGGVLITLWGRENGAWKLQSWQLQAP